MDREGIQNEKDPGKDPFIVIMFVFPCRPFKSFANCMVNGARSFIFGDPDLIP